MTQTALVSRVHAGDRQAERELYDLHVDRVYRLAYRLVGDDDQAAEYTQETFIRVFQRLDTFRGEAALSTWITSIAYSVVFNGMRKRKRMALREVGLDDAMSLGTATTLTRQSGARPSSGWVSRTIPAPWPCSRRS